MALNVTNGDSTVAGLRQAGVAGDVLPWRDVLHEGPVPALPPAALARVRSRFLAAATGVPVEATYRGFRTRDARLSAARGEIVLWFEADLYDQLQLIQVLDRLASVDGVEVTLVAVAEHPGIAHFGGLGELDGEQLAALRETAAAAVDAEALDLARRAWRAFTAPDPDGLRTLRGERSRVLRHLWEAVERLLQEYPWAGDGLSLTERRILQAVAGGAGTEAAAFQEVWRSERRPFLGDVWHRRALHLLVKAGLVRAGPELGLTAEGEAVLEGRADRAALAGLDRWIGGVHLKGAGRWRWDARREMLIDEG